MNSSQKNYGTSDDNVSVISRNSATNLRSGERRKSHYSETQYSTVEEEGEIQITPLPKLQIFIISIVLLSEPMTSTILFPFIYFMLKDFHLSDDEKEIGSYAGWITSVFFIAQFCTAITWGKISDRYGRRPVMLCGLIGNAISVTLFGLSKSLAWAVAARAFCGIMNGNSGVARSMVSEITDNTNKAKAFSMFGFCWGAGMIAGPALGGFLNHPATNFPSLFGSNQFLKEYPYFLPCFVSAVGTGFGFIIAFFFLKESNTKTLKNHENDPLIKNDTQKETKGLSQITRASLLVVAGYSLFGFGSMVFDEVMPLYFTAPTYAGGLGLASSEYAEMLAIMGIIQLIFQFGVYPTLTRHYSILTLCKISLFIFPITYLIFPDLTALRNWTIQFEDQSTGAIIFKMTYMFILLWRYFGNCIAFTGYGIMVSTSAAPEILGTVNGFCQSCISLVRAIAPTLGGSLWSYSLRSGYGFPFDHHLVYYFIVLLALVNLVQSYFIPKSISLGGRKNNR